ncbi:MAG: 1,4-beta-xylanase [Flammeovirgaceae bacterium]|nr:1,4-beta-xylanase [Flammeovirgaceae bacterium]MBE62633.1 1,4-beta-xylanase [Flammeovirgaceae bacterium]HCX20537.1 1,4-beta-xylanase [Cytophagales bacterium]|tara:strand:- start:6756 stop:7955 length:1200 start_codon:yes stop_codon:yes gene_type:complete
MIKLLPALFLISFLAAQSQNPIADGKEKFLGSIHSATQIQDFEQYWNQVTPENAGKWGSVESTRDVYNFTQLDAAYDFAKQNGFPFRYHVLLWGNQQPSWIESLDPEEQLEEIEEWMDTVAARYPDIDYLEVINEPLHDPPSGSGNGNYLQALGGTGTTGYDWIVTGFRIAKERFPNVPLMINDYNILNNPTDANRYVTIINLLKEEGLIDIIGVQGHAFTTTTDNGTMQTVLDLLASTELPIMVTELDIDGLTSQEQLEEYQRIFPLLWEHPSVMGITLWGFRPGLWRNAQKAYLIDTDGSERPALIWLREYVENASFLLTQSEEMNWTLYPNPASDYLEIIAGEPVKGVIVIDLFGRQLLKTSSNKLQLPEDTPPGVYMVSIQTISGKSYVKKLKVE